MSESLLPQRLVFAERAADITTTTAAAAAAAAAQPATSSSLLLSSSSSSSSSLQDGHDGSGSGSGNGNDAANHSLSSQPPPALSSQPSSLVEGGASATGTITATGAQEGQGLVLAPGQGLVLAPGQGLGLAPDESDKPPLIVSWGLLAQSLKRGEEGGGRGQRRTARRTRDRRTRLSLIAQTQGLGAEPEPAPGRSKSGREGEGEREGMDLGRGKDMTELLSSDSEDDDSDIDGENEDEDDDDDDDEEEEDEEVLLPGFGPALSADASPVALTLPLLQEPHPSQTSRPPAAGHTRARASLDSKSTRASSVPKKRTQRPANAKGGSLLFLDGPGKTLMTAAAREREYQGFHLVAPDLYVRANDPCLLMNEIAVLAFIQVYPYYSHPILSHPILSYPCTKSTHPNT